MNVRPRDLPKLRDQTLGHLNDPAAPVRARTGPGNQPSLDAVASHLRAAGLYWVAPDMAALAVASGAALDEARWATADRPSPCGLIQFDGGIGSVDIPGPRRPRTTRSPAGEQAALTLRDAWPEGRLPVDACIWGPAEGGCQVTLLVTRRRLAEAYRALGAELETEAVPPLVPTLAGVLPVTAEPVPWAEAGGGPVPPVVLSALAAAWLLMQQPTLVDRTIERPDRSVRRSYARADREDPTVTVVDLRRQYVPQDQDPADEQEGSRYRHRWVVSGHWRNQPHGPGREQRRQQWIPSHVKGPDGAPLLATERVNVWRR